MHIHCIYRILYKDLFVIQSIKSLIGKGKGKGKRTELINCVTSASAYVFPGPSFQKQRSSRGHVWEGRE
jgi:hypothetical protein